MEFCPTLADHDYVVKSPESYESQLHAAQKCIKELEEEVIQFKAEQFRLALFGYDHKMSWFYTGVKFADLLHKFIRFVKPTASWMKTWSHVQSSKLVSYSTSTVSRTVITHFPYFTLGRLPIWPTRAQIQRHWPLPPKCQNDIGLYRDICRGSILIVVPV